jgi:glycosyltransferase involved in cell wall biosynthesis
MKQKVSVILPVYNVERYIKKCIQSVLDQSYSNFELLIIDDGTTDSSIEIAKEFNDNRISIISKKNEGVSVARNHGLKLAKGQYIYFLDSDDWIEPQLLEYCVDAIKKFRSNVIIFGYTVDRERTNGELIKSENVMHKEAVFEKNKNNLKFYNTTLNLMGYVWNKFYKASFIKENKLQFDSEISLYEDVIFNSKIFKIEDKIVFINDNLYHYIDRPSTSLIKKFNINSFDMTIYAFNSLNQFFTAWSMEKSHKNKVLTDSLVTGIKHSFDNIFKYGSNFNFIQTIKYIKYILNHDLTIKNIIYYEPKSLKSKIYKKLIANKSSYSIYVLFKIIK